MDEVKKKASGLCELLFAAATDAEYGASLSEDGIIILADVEKEINITLDIMLLPKIDNAGKINTDIS